MDNNCRRAVACIVGGPLAPNIIGTVFFTSVRGGTEVAVEVTGLPSQSGAHGFHLHEYGNCAITDVNEPFKDAGGHWNPTDQPHGKHLGDFPVIFSNDGYARMSFFTNKFTVSQTVGKSVIIHEGADDYKTQPSGDAGRRLACGVVQRCIE